MTLTALKKGMTAFSIVSTLVVIAVAVMKYGPGSDQGSAVQVITPSLITDQLRPFDFKPYDEPRPLPEIAFTDGAGRALSLGDFRGRVVLLNIWATWCVPCRREMPSLDRLAARFGGPDFAVLALSIDRKDASVVRDFYREYGIAALKVYRDRSNEVPRAFGVIGVPTTLLIDREGREIGRVIGALEWDDPKAADLIGRLIGNSTTALQ